MLDDVSHAPFSVISDGQKVPAIPFGDGGGIKGTVSKDQPFSGRGLGGGSRAQIYGTSIYGSGFPGEIARGVEGRGFPFVFLPVVFTSGTGQAYLYRESEYGEASYPDRPGGALQYFSVSPKSNITTIPPYTFRVISDNATIDYLHTALIYSCNRENANRFGVIFTAPEPYGLDSSADPSPLDAVQYYRASSVVLTLDGYNNTAAIDPTDTLVAAREIPGNVSKYFLNCLNETIGVTVPLIASSTGAYTYIPFNFGVWSLLLVWLGGIVLR
ncbi:hypothetical protein B0H34DRAFT_663786 [Crassisporium funariophilum]|nr:hypothetical protein B0H34DRAFT_663786 [Crassisporium funariophilum]